MASKREFLYELENLIKTGINLVLVTHSIDEILPSIEKIIFLKNGEIYKSGDKDDLMNRENLKNVLDIDIFINKKSGFFYPEF